MNNYELDIFGNNNSRLYIKNITRSIPIIMNQIVILTFVLILTSCNLFSIPKRFLPERMFSKENIPIATAIYNGDRDAVRDFINYQKWN